MKWIRKIYIPSNPIKHHTVHPGVSIVVDMDIKKNHQCMPDIESECDALRIDPGGIISMNSKPIEATIDDLVVSVKPEHIFGANIVWSEYAHKLDTLTQDGEAVFRINMDSFNCAVMPESVYIKIGAWLASMSALGQFARAEIAALLKDVDGVYIHVPDAIDE